MDLNVLYPLKLIDKMKHHLSPMNTREVASAPKFIFLCGQHIDISYGGNRKLVDGFFRRYRKDVISLYAEDLFKLHKKEIDLLTYEHYLAELSDGIILFIESFGTACELGAFTMLDSLLAKTIVFNDVKHKNVDSFLNEGPIKKIEKLFPSNIVFTDTTALMANPIVFDKLTNIALTKKCKINKNESCVNLKSFIIEILDLICLIGPIYQKDLLYVYKTLKDFSDFAFGDESNNRIKSIQISYILDLLEKASILTKCENWYSINHTHYSFCGLMFRSSIKNDYNAIRSYALSRKFRSKEGIMACL